MTEWKTAFGTQTEKPKELDISSSPTTVYQRRNIKQVEKSDDMGEEQMTITGWEYEERELTVQEYEAQQAELDSPATQLMMQQLSELDLKIEMMGV